MLTNFGNQQILNWFRGQTVTRPTTLALALYTTTWGSGGATPETVTGGTEVAVSGYARVNITVATIFNTAPTQGTPVSGRTPTQIVSGSTIQTGNFATAETVRSVALFSGADAWFAGNLTAPVLVPAGNPFRITTGSLALVLIGAL